MIQKDSNHVKRSKKKGAFILVGFILLIWIFLYYIGPWAANIPMVRPLLKFIEENEIDAGAYYYTDVEEFAEAEFAINQSMTYSPKKN